jgi:ABC-type transport system involved in multi-copper enzyme maturation permease subunit
VFPNVFVAEQTKLLKRRLLWISLAALAALMGFILVGSYVTYQADPAEIDIEFLLWPDAPVAILQLGTQIGVLIVTVLVGASIAQAYGWRTMHLWLSHGVPRPVLLSAKFAAMLLPVLLVILTALVVGGVISAFLTQQIDGTLALSRVNAPELVISVVRTAYTLLPYAALTLLLAVLSRSTAGTIGVVVAYNLLIESLLPISVLRYLPGGLATSLQSLNQIIVKNAAPNAEAAAKLVRPEQAALGIALYTLAFLLLAIWAFRRQDLTE